MDGWVAGWLGAAIGGYRHRQIQEQAHKYFSLRWKQMKPCLNTPGGISLGKRLGSDLYFLLLQFTLSIEGSPVRRQRHQMQRSLGKSLGGVETGSMEEGGGQQSPSQDTGPNSEWEMGRDGGTQEAWV